MTIIEAVRDYLRQWPKLQNERVNVDFLPEDPVTFSVDVTPVTPVVRRYITGLSLRQFSFVLATHAYYGAELRQQLDNLGLFEDFADWIERQNRKRNFPDLGEGRDVRSIEVTTSGYVFAEDAEYARYQIQCRMLYEQEADYLEKEND